MISFATLGKRSRFGNHLFQYAFLRTTARRLGVPFYCPEWEGDSLFCLDDAAERAEEPAGITLEYVEPDDRPGFDPSALDIRDGTNIQGYFQSEKYFDRRQVCEWYRFKPERVAAIRARYAHLDFSRSVGLHVRLGDFVTTYWDRFYVARRTYYLKALDLTPRKDAVLVFSDDISKAKDMLGNLGAPTIYVDRSEAYEDLYLQTQCHDFVCSPSSFSWWGAWLNDYPDKVVVAPKEGPFRPGSPTKNPTFWPESWIKLRALRPLLDGYTAVRLADVAERGGRKLRRLVVG